MHLNCDRQPAPAQGNLKKQILKDSNADKRQGGKKRKQRDKKEEKSKRN